MTVPAPVHPDPADRKTDPPGQAPDGSPSLPEDEKPTVLETIRRLHDRSLTGKNLATDDRRAVVEHLSSDGMSVAQIAEILKVSERTVARDRKAIQQAHALEARPELIPQMVGRLVREAELSVGRIRTAARDKGADPGIRVDAEHRCYLIVSDMVHRLQQLGYLPTAAQRLEANLSHSLDGLPSAGDLQFEIQRLRVVSKDNPALAARLSELQNALSTVNVAEELARVSAQLGSGTSDGPA